jgi:hypothetical protein
VTKQHIHRLSIHPKGDPLPMYCQSLDCTQEFTEERLSEAVNDAAVLGMIQEIAYGEVWTVALFLYMGICHCELLKYGIRTFEGTAATFPAAVRACWQAWKEGSK